MSESPENVSTDGRIYDTRESLDERTTPIRIDKLIRPVGWGHFSSYVAEVEAGVEVGKGKNKKLISHTFVIKQFKDERVRLGHAISVKTSSGQRALDSVSAWKMLREANIKTWQTFRVNEERGLVIMTSGNLDGVVAVMPNNENFAPEAMEMADKVISEEKFDDLVKKVIAEVVKASKEGIFLNTDAYTFFMKTSETSEGKKDVDFLIGDLDVVYKVDFEREAERQKLTTSNISRFRNSLRSFIYKYSPKSDWKKLSAIADNNFRKFSISFDEDSLSEDLDDPTEI